MSWTCAVSYRLIEAAEQTFKVSFRYVAKFKATLGYMRHNILEKKNHDLTGCGGTHL